MVSAASYAARKFGVHSALPLRTAYQLCPQAIFLEGSPGLYREYSQKIHEVMRRFSPKVEQVSIDEAYLDMTGTERLLGRPLTAAHRLHEAVAAETALPCSIGIGTSRLVAKMCSDLAKPNGVLSVEPGAEAAFLGPLEVSRIPGVGKVMQSKLEDGHPPHRPTATARRQDAGALWEMGFGVGRKGAGRGRRRLV